MKKIAIIGAGPVGLYFATLCEKDKIDYTIFESTDKIGGQIPNLYPHKKILDIVGFENKDAIDLINHFDQVVNHNNIKLKEKVNDVIENEDKVKVVTANGNYDFDYVIIAVGLGTYAPRPMGIENENKCKNILYSLDDFSFLKNKRVAIFGGGDSALDWAKEISCLSEDVHLVHRRTEFRGNANTICNCNCLKVHLPYVPFKITMEGDKCSIITIKNVNEDKFIDIPVDYVLVNYGSIPVTTPFNFEHEGNFLKVNEKYALGKRVFAIGDCAFYPNKIRRIEPGKKEANAVFAYLSQLA